MIFQNDAGVDRLQTVFSHNKTSKQLQQLNNRAQLYATPDYASLKLT